MGDDLVGKDLVPVRKSRGMSRRDFLKYGGTVGVVGLAFEHTGIAGALLRDPTGSLLGSTRGPRGGAGPTPSITFNLFRRDDMVDLTVYGYNLQLVLSPQRLTRIDTTKPAFLVYEFAPQHFLEETFADPPGVVPAIPVRTRIAGASRIAFRLANGDNSIPYQVQALLDWAGQGLVQQLPKGVDPANGPGAPTVQQTQIEAPWHLYLAPLVNTAWVHSLTPVLHGDRTEIWHTRLAQTVGGVATEPPNATPQIRAVYTPSSVISNDDPFGLNAPLLASDRVKLVQNMTENAAALPTDVEFFSLSALGATMTVQGNWKGTSTGVTLWRNRTAVGRDSFVRIVKKGYLFPFGFRVSLIQDTQREFRVAPNGEVAAYLVKRQFIQVRDRLRTYPGDFESAATARTLPFTQVQVNTLVSPLLDMSDPGHLTAFLPDTYAFWPRANSQDVMWSLTGLDYDGHAIDFAMPLAFVFAITDDANSLPCAYDPNVMVFMTDLEYPATTASRRNTPFGGQRVTFTPTTNPGDTALPTQQITFAAVDLNTASSTTLNTDDLPAFAPTMNTAQIELSAATALQGGPLGGGPPQIAYHPTYIANGFSAANAGEVFASLVSTPPTPTIPIDRAGGLAAPNFGIAGLSRALGPVGGDLSKLANSVPTFDPTSFFAGNPLLLFGAIDLVQLITGEPLSLPGDGKKLPKITNELIYPGNDKTKAPDGMITSLDWHPTINEHDPTGIFTALNGNLDKHFDLTAKFSTPLANPTFPNTYNVLGELRDFSLTFFPDLAFITLTFSKCHFEAKTGSKPSLDVNITQVDFDGPLTFVNQLKDFLSTGGKGPSIDVEPTGVTVSYTIGLPSIGVGVFTLANVALSAGLGLPFDGSPVHVDFAVCTRERPFLLTMGLFGGGGFFGLSLAADGLRMIEASIEFGAAVELDLGVASGGVHIMAGIYFRLTKTSTNDNEIELTGYLRAGGSLEVLGIITISVEFYLGFTYKSVGKAYGKASVTVTVSILFFSASVTLTVEKTIAGGTDPTFVDNVPTQALWNTYCDAFA